MYYVSKSLWITSSLYNRSVHLGSVDTMIQPISLSLNNSNTGWTVAKTASGSYAALTASTSTTTFTTTPSPSAPLSTTVGEAWVFGPFNGVFRAPSTMSFNWNLIATTFAGQQGKLRYRLWKAKSRTGATSTVITPNVLETNTIIVGTAATCSVSGTFPLTQSISFGNEWLFVESAWAITRASTNNAGDVLFRHGSASYFKSGPYEDNTCFILSDDNPGWSKPSIFDALTAWWALDDPAGGDRHDYLAGRALLESGSVVETKTGLIGNAAHFSPAQGAYLTCPSTAQLVTAGSFSISIWINIAQYPASGDAIIIQKHAAGTTDPNTAEYQITLSPDGHVRINKSNGITGSTCTSPSALPLNTWHCLEFAYASSTDIMSIVINRATSIASKSTTFVTPVITGSGPVSIGGCDTGNFFSGSISFAGLWKRALSTWERVQLYNNGNGLNFPFHNA